MTRSSKANGEDEPLSAQSLKSAIWYTVAKIATEEEVSLPFAASEQFVASLAEVVFQQAQSFGKDLERFAKHAGRMTINVDDVKLAVRRNEPLYNQLCTSASQHGLALADLKGDQSKPKKAPRATSLNKTVVASGPGSASMSKKSTSAKEKEKKSSTVVKGKGKGKAKEVSEDEDSDDGGGGGGEFVKASALKPSSKSKSKSSSTSTSTKKKKGKAAAVDSDIDDDDLDADDGLNVVDGSEIESSDEDDGKKRKKKKKKEAEGGKAKKKRKVVEDSD